MSSAAFGALSLAAPSADEVAYRLSPIFDDQALQALAVEVRMQGDADGSTRLLMPDRWVGATEYWRYVRDVTIDGVASSTADGPGSWVLRHAPGAPITVRYSVVSAYEGDPGSLRDNPTPYAPIVRPTWFLAYGPALFAYPKGREEATARFEWTGPEGFGFASDLEHLAGARPGTVDDALESVAIGGTDLRVSADGPVRVASVGDYPFTHEAFAELALRVISAERAFWGGDTDPFLVTMTPLKVEAGSLSLGGTGRSDAFALQVSESAELPDLRTLLAHEYFHTWNARRLGLLDDGRREPAGYWVSEGFTDFYTRRIGVRSGLLSIEEFLAEWNTMLLRYATSSARTEPDRRVVRAFWTDPEVEKLPYQRGAILAATWDARLRRATDGRADLDDVMYAMRDETSASTAPERFVRLYAAEGGGDVRADVARYVRRGKPVLLPPDAFGTCVRVATTTIPAFDRGFDRDATARAGNVVTGLRTDSPAWAAGLRDGMKILERVEGVPDDSRVDYVLRVDDGGAERIVRFAPIGAGAVTLQELVLSDEGATAEACARSLGGS